MEQVILPSIAVNMRTGRPGYRQLLSQANKRARDLLTHLPAQETDPRGASIRRLRLASNQDPAMLASQACISVPQLYELENGQSSLFYSASLRNQAGRRVARLLGANWDTLAEAAQH